MWLNNPSLSLDRKVCSHSGQGHSRLRWSRPRLAHVRFNSDSDRQPSNRDPALRGHVWTAPSWQGESSRRRLGSVQPCVRPFDAVRMTAGHNALRGSGPGHKLAFENAVARVGCPDRRIDRLCITCCSPSQPSHHAMGTRRDLVRPAARQDNCIARPLAIMAQAIRASLLASAMAATLVGRRASNAATHGRYLVPWSLA